MGKRVQGTEHEYTLYCRKMGTLGFDPHVLALDLLRESDLHLAGEFVKNGSRAYYDVGHFEVSTCEVSNPWDLVTWEKAGEKILDWLRKVMEDKYTAGGVKIHAFKNNTSPDGTSYGSHENYCVSRDVEFPQEYVRELVPHLATRFIYTGAGDIIDGKYVLSPMAYLTSTVVSGETMHDTGLLNTRDEPHADARKWRRLHVIVGDALMNETAILLRHFVTSSILELMEKDLLNDVPKLESPVDDVWQYAEIGEERSLFYKRQRKGLLDRVTTDEKILRAIQEPPKDTRAALRRNLCDKFNIEAIDWSLLVVNDGTRRRIDLYDPYATELEEYAAAI